ncbi:hypothetical protein H3V53_01780 [Paraburkholderia bengalensis]|uniref:Prepilin-type N-terminal cleavage/methylation domain-containing protein n=1 Tax=Paraburkholderia bengalensis TaxID=2747562 RepID=A0ABU8IKE7_9BURK
MKVAANLAVNLAVKRSVLIQPSILSFKPMSTPNRANARRSLTLLETLGLVGIAAALCSALLRHFF